MIGQLYNTHYQTRFDQSLKFLDLNTFKTEKCTNTNPDHCQKKCVYYHDFNKDRRRKLGIYQSEKCNRIKKGQDCPDGDACTKAHNRVEEFYHPDKYKAKFCSVYLDRPIGQGDLVNRYQLESMCEYGEYCSFAHGFEELSVELLEQYLPDYDFYLYHFKTVWCPYRENDHDAKLCVYAHNW